MNAPDPIALRVARRHRASIKKLDPKVSKPNVTPDHLAELGSSAREALDAAEGAVIDLEAALLIARDRLVGGAPAEQVARDVSRAAQRVQVAQEELLVVLRGTHTELGRLHPTARRVAREYQRRRHGLEPADGEDGGQQQDGDAVPEPGQAQ